MNWVRGTVPGRHDNIRIGADRVPQRLQYSAGIILRNAEGMRLSRSSTPSAEVARTFFAEMTEALDKVKSLPTGAALIRDIDTSGHELHIIRGPDGYADGSCVIPYPGDMKTAEQRFVRQLRPPPKNKLDAMASQGMWVKPKQAYTSELTRLLDRAQRSNARFTRQTIAALLGIPPKWLQEMEEGTRRIEDNEYYRLCLYLYEELAPGAGTSAEMRVVMTQVSLPDEPLFIVVGHELVHAWRIMKGRRIFENGWEEEAMTTGLPPFSSMRFSENRLRVEANLPMREKYSKICSTSLLNAIRDLHTQPAREDRPFPERDIIGKAGKPLA
jgi:hypothetical protein